MSQILVGLIGIPLGLLIIVYREKIHNVTGTFGWAEQYLGTGGTYTALFGIGLTVSIASLMWMMGTLQAGLIGFLGPLMGVN